MAIWHLGEGRHKEKFRAAAPVKGGAGDQVSWTLPLSQRIHEKSVQGQAQPPGSGWILSLLFGQRWEKVWRQPLPTGGQNATEQHNDGGGGKD